jgi:hypothetical protein
MTDTTPQPAESVQTKKKGLAIASLVLGIASIPWCFGLLAGLPAIILGFIGAKRAKHDPKGYGGRGLAMAGIVLGCLSLAYPVVAPSFSGAKGTAERIQCTSNLRIIGAALRDWSGDSGGRLPWNVRTDAGGTMELAQPNSEGFDKNPWVHFQVLSNELGEPKYLVCPSDSAKVPAKAFSDLQAVNVSYEIRSVTNAGPENPSEILVRCPIHGAVLLSDGSVELRQIK